MIGWVGQVSPSDAPVPPDPAGWVPAVVVGVVLGGLWAWAYVARRRASRR